jgi:hypothetical protein
MTVLIGYDLQGLDLVRRNLTSYDSCCAWCQSDNACVSYTWGLSTAGWAAYTCFLKYAVPTPSANPVLVSAHH